MPSWRDPRPLILVLLAGTASGADLPTFKVHVRRACYEGRMLPPKVEMADHPDFAAWVTPPLQIIYLDREYLRAATDADACDTAYHEVCHLWLEVNGHADPEDHSELVKCKRLLGVGRCRLLEPIKLPKLVR